VVTWTRTSEDLVISSAGAPTATAAKAAAAHWLPTQGSKTQLQLLRPHGSANGFAQMRPAEAPPSAQRNPLPPANPKAAAHPMSA
jgi:hypothetical protein